MPVHITNAHHGQTGFENYVRNTIQKINSILKDFQSSLELQAICTTALNKNVGLKNKVQTHFPAEMVFVVLAQKDQTRIHWRAKLLFKRHFCMENPQREHILG